MPHISSLSAPQYFMERTALFIRVGARLLHYTENARQLIDLHTSTVTLDARSAPVFERTIKNQRIV